MKAREGQKESGTRSVESVEIRLTKYGEINYLNIFNVKDSFLSVGRELPGRYEGNCY